jgi:hypothetical protein
VPASAALFNVLSLSSVRKIHLQKFWKLAAAGCVLSGAIYAAPPRPPSVQENYLFHEVNRERVERGLPALQWDDSLAEAAQRHTSLMAREKTLSHQLGGELALQERASQAGAHFSQIAENIGEASGVPDLHYGWMHSAGHRANILDPKYTSLGIAVRQAGGRYFATQDFSDAVVELSFKEQEERMAKLLEKRGLHVTQESNVARGDCDTGANSLHAMQGTVMHFETPDLTQLPEPLQKMIDQHAYRNADVAACKPTPAGGFTRYRFAILFY